MIHVFTKFKIMTETILAVDDDTDILDLLEMSLTSDGFNVITAGDGPNALAQAKASSPDLILLDLMMPGMDGIAVINALKAAGGEIMRQDLIKNTVDRLGISQRTVERAIEEAEKRGVAQAVEMGGRGNPVKLVYKGTI